MTPPIIRRRNRSLAQEQTLDPVEVVGPPDQIDQPDAPPATSSNYKVGKGKPPLNRRFGQPDGNRSGRKKGAKTFDTQLLDELASKITVTQDGRERKYSKQALIVRALANAAIQGKAPHLRMIVQYLTKLQTDNLQPAPAATNDGEPLSHTDEAILARYSRSVLEEARHKGGDQ